MLNQTPKQLLINVVFLIMLLIFLNLKIAMKKQNWMATYFIKKFEISSCNILAHSNSKWVYTFWYIFSCILSCSTLTLLIISLNCAFYKWAAQSQIARVQIILRNKSRKEFTLQVLQSQLRIIIYLNSCIKMYRKLKSRIGNYYGLRRCKMKC